MAPHVAIIGLGVVGSALADELVLRGWNDVTVVEQGPLYVTGGSSSHAPGFVFQTSPSRSMSLLAQRTLDKLDGLELRGEWLMKRTGGLEIASTQERAHELKRRRAFADAAGIPSQLIGPEEISALWPELDTSGLTSALHTPTDAVVKGVRAVEFQASRAQVYGARILPHAKVVGIPTRESRVIGLDVLPVGAPQDAEPERIPADIVVSAAGLWGRAWRASCSASSCRCSLWSTGSDSAPSCRSWRTWMIAPRRAGRCSGTRITRCTSGNGGSASPSAPMSTALCRWSTAVWPARRSSAAPGSIRP